MLQVAIEEEVFLFLGRDHYKRRANQKGYRNGYKARVIKTGSGDIGINMPQVRYTDIPFHFRLIPPYASRVKEIEEVIPLLYLYGLSTRKVSKVVGKVLGKRGLSGQNVVRISKKIVNEFNRL